MSEATKSRVASERGSVSDWVVFTILVLWGLTGFATSKVNREQGRAEMKLWQDAWYASHPVVKEVPIIPPKGLSLPPGEWSCSEHGCRPLHFVAVQP